MSKKLIALPIFMLALYGCTTTTDTTDETADNANTNVNANANTGGDGSTTTTELTDEQAAAVDAAAQTVAGLAASASAMIPMADLQSVLAALEDAAPGCPTIAGSNGAGTITLTLDYGAGCAPAPYPDATASGSVSGTYAIDLALLSLMFSDFSYNSQTLDGSVALTLGITDGSATFSGTVDLMLAGVGTVTGAVTMSVNIATGVTTISTESVTLVDDQGLSLVMELDDIVIDPAGNENLLPQAGSMTVIVPNTGSGPATITLTITFTSGTPSTGIVLVSVGGAAPTEYTLGSTG